MERLPSVRSRTWIIVVVAVAGIIVMAGTYRVALAGYRQGLTEAHLREIALAVKHHETATGAPVEDVSTVVQSSLFVDARRGERVPDALAEGTYRVGDFIFTPATWRADPAREPLLGWTDAVESYRVVVLRDGRTKTLSPAKWKILHEAGITP